MRVQGGVEHLRHTHLTLDVIPGRGGRFSLEGPPGARFPIRWRVHGDELAALRDRPIETG